MKRKKKGGNNEDDDDNGFAAWGGYMEAKKSKLRDQFKSDTANETNKESDIFKGISIFVNGYTNPTASELKQLMSLHGGIYHHYHNSKTSFIIASNLPDTKIKQLGSNQNHVKPEWISDSVKAGKLLDFTNYLLYSNHNRKQPKLGFNKMLKESITSTHTSLENDVVDEYALSPDIFCSDEEPILIETNKNEKQPNKSIVSTSEHRTMNANNPNFLSEFYNNSRLHHIATLGATFKQHICDLREESNFVFPERQRLKDYVMNCAKNKVIDSNMLEKETVIMHIDMDCFFVSVGLRNKPELKGKPVAVTHSKGGQEPTLRSGVNREAELQVYKQRIQEKLKSKGINDPKSMLTRLDGIENQSMSEIASCSYEARQAGVKNGMFMGTALKLCPNLQTIAYDFAGYKEVAYTLYNTIAEYTLNIEGVSCDEMFVDISELLRDTKVTVDQWATYIRTLIQDRTGCPCSTGFGKNRLQARMATRTAKPNGQFYLIQDIVEEYMMSINVRDLPGVGYSTSIKLDSLGIKSCGDLQAISLGKLRSEFGGKIGETLYNHCRGIDDRPLVYEHERKSVSAEVNYGIRFKSNCEAETFLRQVATEVHNRLVEVKMKGKCITLKFMVRSKDAPIESSKFMGHGICDNVTKSSTLSTATCDLDIIVREVLLISQKLSIPPSDLRGIGIQISKLEKVKKAPGNLTKLFSNMNSIKRKEETIIISEDEKKNHTILNRTSPQKIELNGMVVESVTNKINDRNEFTMTRRGKGRPRGARGGKTIERKNSNNGGNLNKFLTTDNNASSISTTNSALPQQLPGIPFSDIDLDVFSELPAAIQKEILEQYQNKNNNKNATNISPKSDKEITLNDKTKINISPCITTTTITATTTSITTRNNNNNNNKKDNEINNSKNNSMFFGMNIKEIKNIIHDWVRTENAPELCDVKMLGEYFKQLALDKKISNLFMMLKFLYSEILFKEGKCCGWHRSYLKVIESAQNGMIARYGKTIKVYKDFKCKNKCHLTKR